MSVTLSASAIATASAMPTTSVVANQTSASMPLRSVSYLPAGTPDVVANPWNTSLLWSYGVLDDQDPNSDFYPLNNWHNNTIPANVNTAPIGFYYSSTHAGDLVNFLFTGSSIAVLDFKAPGRGRYNISIDNNYTVTIDASSSVNELNVATGTTLPPAIWRSQTLQQGTHSVVMTNMDDNAAMQFWGVIINPNNYTPGQSFVHASGSSVNTIVIAASVTAAVMFLIFLLAGSLLYFYKVIKPRRRIHQADDVEPKDPAVVPESERVSPYGGSSTLASYGNTADKSVRSELGSLSQMRLDNNFHLSMAEMGRASRLTVATNESQFWVPAESRRTPVVETRRSPRVPALFQEMRLGSTHMLDPSMEDDELEPASPVETIDVDKDPVSPAGYATEPTRSRRSALWEASLLSYQGVGGHRQSNSVDTNLHIDTGNLATGISNQHARVASSPASNPFRGSPTSSSGTSSLARSASRRPLPMPPAASASSNSIPTGMTLSPGSDSKQAVDGSSSYNSAEAKLAAAFSGGSSSAEQRFRVEQDGGVLHVEEEGLVDESTGETLIPPPYVPREEESQSQGQASSSQS